MLEDRRVRLWYDNVTAGAKSTADNYLRSMGRFCEKHGLDPRQLLAMESEARDDLLQEEVHEMASRDHAGDYIEDILKAIRSWLAFNRKKIEREIKVPRNNLRKTVRDEVLPDQAQLRRIFDAADPQQRAIVGFVAHAGVRPEVLGRYEAEDGLRLQHLPELQITAEGPKFTRIPAMVVVPEHLSKTGKRYLTFLGAEAASYVEAHLRERMARGHQLRPQTPVITADVGDGQKPIRRSSVCKAVKAAFKAANWKGRPYSLRHFFAHRLMVAESRGCAHSAAEFFMGHGGGVSAVYRLNKTLHPDAIEELRRAYARALPLLETATNGADDPRSATLRTILSTAGLSEAEIADAGIESMSPADAEAFVTGALRKMIADSLAKQAGSVRTDPTPPRARAETPKEITVQPSELDSYLSRSWSLKMELKDGRLVLTAPV